jgi:hypothetical protein
VRLVCKFDYAGQWNELLVDGRARFEVVAAEEDRGAGVGIRVGGERVATVMVHDRNYEGPGFNYVQAVAEGGGSIVRTTSI